MGGGLSSYSVTHGSAAGVNALSIQAKTNPNQAKQNPEKNSKQKKKSTQKIKFQSGFHGMAFIWFFFFFVRNNWIFSVLSHAWSGPSLPPLMPIHHGQHVSLQLVKDFSIFFLVSFSILFYFFFLPVFFIIIYFYLILFLPPHIFCGRSFGGVLPKIK